MRNLAPWGIAAGLIAVHAGLNLGTAHAVDLMDSPGRIDAWTFDAPNRWSVRGIAPVSTSGVAVLPGLSGNAVRIQAEPLPVGLEYPVLGPGLSQTLRFDQGALRFLYRPDWDTARGGPGEAAVLLQVEASELQPRGFRWQVNPSGTHLDWVQYEGEGEVLITRGGIRWPSNRWVEITATYGGPEGPSLYTNGVPTRVEGTPQRRPSLANPGSLRPVRLRIGSDGEGRRSAHGSFDEVELFLSPLSEPVIEADRLSGLWAETSTNPVALDLRWRGQPGWTYRVRRWDAQSDSWAVLATGLRQWGYTDRQVERGRRYEYAVNTEQSGAPDPIRYLPAGVEVSPVHSRGRVLLLVDQTLAAGLEPELAQLRQDLIVEGWWPVQEPVPRHVDTPWRENPPLVERVRARVAAEYARSGPPLRALYLIGHVPVPHSGFYQPDGHARRPFPADGYYGDVERGTNDWTDLQTYRAAPSRLGGGPPAVPNEPGDGLLDQNRYPSPLDLAVGRVDFANLPSFTQRPPEGVRVVPEVELLRRYLDKVHRYRRGELVFPDRVTVYRAPPPIYSFARATRIPWCNTAAWFGSEPWRLEAVDPFREGQARGYLLASVSGYGGYGRIGGAASGQWTTADFARPEQEPAVAFYFLDGSYLGDYNLGARPIQDTLVRAALAPAHSGLAAVWPRLQSSSVSLQALGLGDPLGEAWWSMLRFPELHNGMGYKLGNMHLGLLGDPTLRIHLLKPPQGLTATREGATVALRWAAVLESDTRYFVYRSAQSEYPAFRLLTADSQAAVTWIDTEPLREPAVYLVRPARPTRTGCGSFHNLGPGSLVDVPSPAQTGS